MADLSLPVHHNPPAIRGAALAPNLILAQGPRMGLAMAHERLVGGVAGGAGGGLASRIKHAFKPNR